MASLWDPLDVYLGKTEHHYYPELRIDIPRPPDAFLIYRMDHTREMVYANEKAGRQSDVAQEVAALWEQEPEHVKAEYEELAERVKARHEALHPHREASSSYVRWTDHPALSAIGGPSDPPYYHQYGPMSLEEYADKVVCHLRMACQAVNQYSEEYRQKQMYYDHRDDLEWAPYVDRYTLEEVQLAEEKHLMWAQYLEDVKEKFILLKPLQFTYRAAPPVDAVSSPEAAQPSQGDASDPLLDVASADITAAQDAPTELSSPAQAECQLDDTGESDSSSFGTISPSTSDEQEYAADPLPFANIQDARR